ncbi:transposase [Candidatus Tisiphia endosymbiont of Sialis lutaria]|uniref:transposase n=1 Tax=Candidatus Tisiphia endosymbiont of Sialis lutaria TaxID=2029164 RepID=UPI00312C8E6F
MSLEELVSEEHQYRKFKELFNFNKIQAELTSVEPASNYKGYGVERLFKCLLLQFMEDLSDRELERYLSDSNAAKWFCEFNLREAIVNSGEVGDVVTSRRLPTITKVILYFTLFGCKK